MYLVTGSAGHLGEAIMRMGRARGLPMRGMDKQASPFTDITGDIADAEAADAACGGVSAILHTATLHKPHVATHPRQAFVDTNITGTLTLLDAARASGVAAFVFTSTTSAFGAALRPPPGAPAAWIDEDVVPVPKNIYGATKTAAEDLCHLYANRFGLPALVLRTARFFPEPDDDPEKRATFDDANAKANEFAFRRVDIEDAAEAHFLAAIRAPELGFARFILSAPTPFRPEDGPELRRAPARVLERRCPGMTEIYAARGWRMFDDIDRVYDSARAQQMLGWQPRHTFAAMLDSLANGSAFGSDLARAIGVKGYHGAAFSDGLYPTDAATPERTQA